MCYKADSTSPKVKQGHVESVRQILDAFEVKGIVVELRGQEEDWFLDWSEEFPEKYEDDEEQEGEDVDGYNSVTGYKPFWSDSPEAIRRVDLPSQDQYPDKEKWDKALFHCFLKNGSQGFLALLAELAAHLEGPLTILVLTVISEERLEWNADVFAVQPGQTQVATLSLGQP